MGSSFLEYTNYIHSNTTHSVTHHVTHLACVTRCVGAYTLCRASEVCRQNCVFTIHAVKSVRKRYILSI
jgi:hypothetical protein